jgi:hypothetical protein
MKLSEATIEVLKNFSTLNQSLLFKKGSVLKTITPTSTVLGIAKIKEVFPLDFAIYDLNKFLAKLSLYKDCKLDFKEDRLVFKSDDGRRSDYTKYCSIKVIKSPPDKELSLDNPEYQFVMSQEDLLWQRKSAGISGSQHLIFRGDGKKIYLQSTDMKDDSSDLSSTAVGETTGKFACVIKTEYLKIMDGSYRVKLSGDFVKFENTERDLEYFVAVESALSKFN